jgi:hypothetical protein
MNKILPLSHTICLCTFLSLWFSKESDPEATSESCPTLDQNSSIPTLNNQLLSSEYIYLAFLDRYRMNNQQQAQNTLDCKSWEEDFKYPCYSKIGKSYWGQTCSCKTWGLRARWWWLVNSVLTVSESVPHWWSSLPSSVQSDIHLFLGKPSPHLSSVSKHTPSPSLQISCMSYSTCVHHAPVTPATLIQKPQPCLRQSKNSVYMCTQMQPDVSIV